MRRACPSTSCASTSSASTARGLTTGSRAETGSTPKVLLLIESSRASGRDLLRGIARYSHDHGPWSFYWEPGGLEKAWPKLRSTELQGMIVRDVGKLEEALAFGIANVVVGHKRAELAGQVNVVTDSVEIGRMGAEHLLACGFKHFAFCGFEEARSGDVSWSELRKAGFSKRLEEAGFVCHARTVSKRSSRSMQQQRQALSAWLKSLPSPLGLMACNDDCGAKVMEACRLAELSVPDTVGVVGADNDEIVCGLSDPAMSSIATNFERAGYEAAQALDLLMRKSRSVAKKIIVIPTHVVARRSTDVIAVDEPHVGKALRFIRDHDREALSVGDVARAAGLSRRALERRVRKQVGRSVLQQIRLFRTDRIARLLVETHLPMSHIAETLGFPDLQHFARYFRSEKKISPLAYRKAYGERSTSSGAPMNGASFPHVEAETAPRKR